MNNPSINILQYINLGTDSKLQLVVINDKKYILKTFLGPDATIKRDREFRYHQELSKLGLNSFQFYYQELIEPNQLCINYIEDLKLFVDILDIQSYITLAKCLEILQTKSQSKENYGQYYNWLCNEIKQAKTDTKYIDFGIQLIEEFRNEDNNLILLHSDFHDNNVGMFDDNQIILFDSGHCPYLFGHKYHDLSRLIMYYPDKIIFQKSKIWPKMVPIIGIIKDKKQFLKFCYIQSLLIYNNQWVTRAKEINQYLFEQLK